VVPVIHGATIRNTGGSVELVNLSGPVAVENGVAGSDGGDVSVCTGAPMTERVALQTTKGSVLYQVGPGSTGRFDLSSDKGEAEFSSTMGSVSGVKPEEGHYRGVLDGGQNPITLHSGKGTVRVQVMPNAGTYGPTYWNGDVKWPSSPAWLAHIGETMHFKDKD
jgi:hypothetical protein